MSERIQVDALSARIAAAYELARVGLRLPDVQRAARTPHTDIEKLQLAMVRLKDEHLLRTYEIARTLHRDPKTVAYHLGRCAG